MEFMTTITTIPSDTSLRATTQPLTTKDTTTMHITTEETILIITTEVPTVHTTLDITQDITIILDIRMEIIKDIVQTIPASIRLILATKDTILTTLESILLTMKDSTIKDITKVDYTTTRLPTTELIMSRQARINERLDVLVDYSQIIMRWCQPAWRLDKIQGYLWRCYIDKQIKSIPHYYDIIS